MTDAPWIAVSGLDGSGKTTLVGRIAQAHGAFRFRLPYHDWVHPAIKTAGRGLAYGDPHTDRLVFAADARLAHYAIQEWKRTHQALVSQRGWMDNFVFGAVQGFSYEETDRLLITRDLVRPSAIIYLIADVAVAEERLRLGSTTDKFETPRFLPAQHRETLRFITAVENDPALAAFRGIPSLSIDTTSLTRDGMWDAARTFVSGAIKNGGTP